MNVNFFQNRYSIYRSTQNLNYSYLINYSLQNYGSNLYIIFYSYLYTQNYNNNLSHNNINLYSNIFIRYYFDLQLYIIMNNKHR